ncbi:MAG: pilus assembly FimT family protein [Candidatus Hinthialibacter sp.]
MVNMRARNAFTLIELTLAILLLAIMTAIGVPSFRSLYEYSEMKRVASDFIGALRYAQQRAIQERNPIRVVVDVEENTYWVPVEAPEKRRHYTTRRRHRSASSRRSASRRNKKVEEINEIFGSLPKGFVFEFVYKVAQDDEIRRGEGEIYFYPDGSADQTFITILWLAKEREDEKRLFLKISPATGFISSMEGSTQQQGSDFYQGYYDEWRQ